MLRKGLPLEAALDTAARGLAPNDRGLAHAIAAEALRRIPDLDALIDGATHKRLADDSKARAALRIALVQALSLGTPPHAAISTVLPLVDGGPRRLVHGVFGAVLRSGNSLPPVPTLPASVSARWERNWGAGTVEAAARLLAAPPPLDLTFAQGSEPPPEMGGFSLLPGHLRLPERPAVAGLAGYGEGRWWVQDLAASIPARLLGDGDGRTVLDLCAAPGGKTLQLCATGFQVTAVDSSESRLRRLSENLERTRMEARLIAADILSWSPPEKVDAILLDAPCSATGIYRRHPDVLYRLRPKAVAELAEAQKAMLARVAGWLKPGGLLVYSVCSLEPEEGEQAVDAFLAGRDDYESAQITEGELPDSVPLEGNRIRILPKTFEADGGADGFFIARFRRTE